VAAISHAGLIANWQENLLEKEMPPVWMWALDEELDLHFKRMKAKRAAKYGADDDDDDDEPLGRTAALENELARNRGRHAR
jgi:hypothetical protein